MQMLIGILIGIAGLIVVTALGALLYYLRQASVNLKRAADIFGRSAEMSALQSAQVVATRRMIGVMEELMGVIKTFNGIVLKGDGPVEQPQEIAQESRLPWGRTPPPPMVPAYDEFAGDDEAGVLSQSEEEQAEAEAHRLAREQGIETDIDMIPMPDADRVKFIQS